MTTSTQRLKERITELEEENAQLTEALENITSVANDAINPDEEDSEDDADE